MKGQTYFLKHKMKAPVTLLFLLCNLILILTEQSDQSKAGIENLKILSRLMMRGICHHKNLV